MAKLTKRAAAVKRAADWKQALLTYRVVTYPELDMLKSFATPEAAKAEVIRARGAGFPKARIVTDYSN